uniref:Uncharacterized protein n=1 Tax=Solanum lycopersicum TaxID=4081 RepID=A0A3Q7H056_SOLLC
MPATKNYSNRTTLFVYTLHEHLVLCNLVWYLTHQNGPFWYKTLSPLKISLCLDHELEETFSRHSRLFPANKGEKCCKAAENRIIPWKKDLVFQQEPSLVQFYSSLDLLEIASDMRTNKTKRKANLAKKKVSWPEDKPINAWHKNGHRF